ncbi:MAG: hypothetical protein SOT67_03830 [Bacteroidaceae bacterium]|nr:hypothetical protein [Prevotellaceae bacterium]MDY2849379.1 hypothetical protein [Bacteroidaceae bacterium]
MADDYRGMGLQALTTPETRPAMRHNTAISFWPDSKPKSVIRA